MTIPIKFRGKGELSNATYAYRDIANATGFVIYYGASAVNSAGTTYFLTPNVIEAGAITSHANSDQDVDYDLQFNVPQTVKGSAIINVTLGANAVAAVDMIMAVTATIKHYDGTTETTIGTTQTTETITAIQAGPKISKRVCLKVPLTTKGFGKGDILRLTLTTVKSQGSGQYGWGNDPDDRNDDIESAANQIILDTDSTTLKVHIPYRIDL